MSLKHDDSKLMRTGAVTVMVLALLMAVAFNLQKIPGFRGAKYHAEFTDASGLHVGDRVEIAGIRVGRGDGIRIDGAKVVVDFDAKAPHLGDTTGASIQVLNLLGEKFLNLDPNGSGNLPHGATIPVARTTAGYDIVGTLDDLTTTTEDINTDQLSTALSTLADTVNTASPQVKGSLEGLSRLSQTISQRDEDINQLLTHAQHVVELINQRKSDLVGLMNNGNQVFAMLIQRRDDIDKLLQNATTLSDQLQGLAKDNEQQIGPALDQLHQALTFLNARKQEITDTIKYYGPYAQILINIIGTGPWFDAYIPNMTGLFSGEFTPGKRPGLS